MKVCILLALVACTSALVLVSFKIFNLTFTWSLNGLDWNAQPSNLSEFETFLADTKQTIEESGLPDELKAQFTDFMANTSLEELLSVISHFKVFPLQFLLNFCYRSNGRPCLRLPVLCPTLVISIFNLSQQKTSPLFSLYQLNAACSSGCCSSNSSPPRPRQLLPRRPLQLPLQENKFLYNFKGMTFRWW